jgi:hypothetical protein
MAKAAPKAAPKAESAPAPQAVTHNSPIIAREIARPVMPTIPGRAVALNRAGQPVQRAAAETGVNEFAIPAHLPPPGWSWEWKEETVLGEVRQGYAAKLAQVAWEPVMMESYSGHFAPAFNDKGEEMKGPVRRGGLMLMERPMTLTLEAIEDDKRRANAKINGARSQYTQIRHDQSQTGQAAPELAAFRQTVEPAIDYAPPPQTINRPRQPIE